MSSGEARCPLGFTGTPPIGHPTIHGSGAGKGGEGKSQSTSSSSSYASTLADYKPSTLLIFDAIFLGLCIIAAIYRDDLKAFIGKYITISTSSSTSVNPSSSASKK